jgi:hypothetical protein
MSERRRKARAKVQPAPLNIQLAAAEERSDKSREVRNARMDRLGAYLMDVSKYVLTVVMITSLFSDMTDYTVLFFISTLLVTITLAAGLFLTRK